MSPPNVPDLTARITSSRCYRYPRLFNDDKQLRRRGNVGTVIKHFYIDVSGLALQCHTLKNANGVFVPVSSLHLTRNHWRCERYLSARILTSSLIRPVIALKIREHERFYPRIHNRQQYRAYHEDSRHTKGCIDPLSFLTPPNMRADLTSSTSSGHPAIPHFQILVYALYRPQFTLILVFPSNVMLLRACHRAKNVSWSNRQTLSVAVSAHVKRHARGSSISRRMILYSSLDVSLPIARTRTYQ